MIRSVLLIVLCWPLLASSASVPVPAVPGAVYFPAIRTAVAVRQAPTPLPIVEWRGQPLVQVGCTPAVALVVLREDVVPVGRAEAWSCTSLDQAQRWLAYHVALVRSSRQCYEASPPPDCPAPPND